MAKKRILDDSDSDGSDEEADTKLRVNQAFKAEFEAREQKRLSAREKALGLDGSDDSDESSSESEDEAAELLTPGLDLKILETINAIRAKDPRVYDGTTRFFDDEAGAAAPAAKKAKPKTFKDVTREQLLAGDAGADSSDDEAPSGLAYDAEQRALRRSLLEAARDDGGGELFAVKERAPEPADDAASLKLRAELEKFEATSRDKAGDAFLADFVEKRRWAEPDAGDFQEDDDDDAADAFEATYNFRFEQEGSSRITGHSRDVPDSLRRPDERRKAKREARKERKEAERRRKEEELKRLKNLQKAERNERAARVAAEAGVAAAAEALEGDFDPEEYDRQMAAAFGDEYYDAADAGAKIAADDGDDASDDEAGALDEARVARSVRRDAAQSLHVEAPPENSGGFRYKAVEASDYGLTVEEILETPDEDLQQLVSIKRLAPYRDREFVVSGNRRKKWRQDQVQRKAARVAAREAERKKRKRQKKKEKLAEAARAPADAPGQRGTGVEEEEAVAVPEKKRSRKRKKKEVVGGPALAPRPKKTKGVSEAVKALSDERRAAYGL